MYTLTLTQEDMDTIHFVGGRYSWSDVLGCLCTVGVNELAEPEAWDLSDALWEDNQTFCPMLDPDSELASKLVSFWESVV